MTKKRKGFDWSSLTRYGIANLMWELKDDIINRPYPILNFHNKIFRHLKKVIPVRSKKSFSPKVEEGFVYVGGCYWSDYDMQKKKCIEIIFEYRSDTNYINLNSKKYWNMCLSIADAILHEIMHMRQYRRRNFKVLPDYESNAEKTELRQEQNYLGCSDEIDAYSFNIACELFEKFKGNKKQIIDYLNQNQKNKKRKHNSWRMYLKAFEHNHDHVIIKRVKKKVVHYLAAAELGKPYRNKDWIDY